jgi:predicted thioesterase
MTDREKLVGISTRKAHLIGNGHVTGHVQPAVLSTPELVRFIEVTCAELVRGHLDDAETTVGTKICVTHDAAAHIGETITIDCVVRGIRGRRVSLEVEAHVEDRRISHGSHEQAVVFGPA